MELMVLLLVKVILIIYIKVFTIIVTLGFREGSWLSFRGACGG